MKSSTIRSRLEHHSSIIKQFMGEDFLLTNSVAEQLYHDFAEKLPIIDYHNHLSSFEIAENRMFNSLTEAWLEGDHYKWRAMRANGIDESYITGTKSGWEKFEKWAETVPFTMRNPLYHWTHLELKRYFNIHDTLNKKTAQEIYDQANSDLNTPAFTSQGLLDKMQVEIVCTTDDPIDNLISHRKIVQQKLRTKVVPTFRPDKLYNIEDSANYQVYLKKLGEACNLDITTYTSLLKAAKNRINFFHENGCRLSDHGLEQLYDVEYSVPNAELTFNRLMEKKEISENEVKAFKMTTISELAKMYHEVNWTQQYHLGAIRDNNTKQLRSQGPNTGYDSIGDFPQAQGLRRFLDVLDHSDQLPQTIVYNLNPSDNEVFATMVGNFNEGPKAGKIQHGAAWWFLDQKDGIEKHLNSLSNMALLSRFVGMLTDSRSFLSYPRHEYFRRILCNLIGKDVENGELPHDLQWLGSMVQDISYYNAKNYFRF